jgi:hypothetical protein
MVSDPQAAAKRILEHDVKATPGPWETEGDVHGAALRAVTKAGHSYLTDADGDLELRDAEAIAAFRSDAPVVARAYQEAIERTEELEDALRDVLSIECGWCAPSAKRSWPLVKEIASRALGSGLRGDTSPEARTPPDIKERGYGGQKS